MPITVLWDNEEHTVIRGTFAGEWDVEDFHRCNIEFDTLLDSLNYRVNILLDLRESKITSVNMVRVMRLQRFHNAHPNIGVLVSIGNNAFIRSLVNAFMKIYPRPARRFYMAESDEEAYMIFEQENAAQPV